MLAPAAERGVIPVQRFLGTPEAQGNGLVVPAVIQVGPQEVQIGATKNFGVGDGWSLHKGRVTERRRVRGDFNGRNGAEPGVGDGRGPLRAGFHHEARERKVHFTGIDVDAWRAVLAYQNLLAAGVPADQLTILVGGAVNELLARDPDDRRSGWNLACLPQAPGTEVTQSSHEDYIDPSRDSINGAGDVRLGPFRAEEVGLALNVAYLEALRSRVTESGTDVQVTLSGRIPTIARDELFRETGWQVIEAYRTKEPPLQDHDTDTRYVGDYAGYLDPANGDGFFEEVDGRYAPLTPAVAESRRQNDGPDLNVRHHVWEILAQPVTAQNRGEPISIYEI